MTGGETTMAEFRECRYAGLPGGPANEHTPRSSETEALPQEALTTIREDEVEVYDLGFIVEEHDERRMGLLEHWQRLETLDTDEALETNRRGRYQKKRCRCAGPECRRRGARQNSRWSTRTLRRASRSSQRAPDSW